MPATPVSFASDVRPVFAPYRDQMAWRFDLARYQDVKANARIILEFIQGPQAAMPPTPFPPFPDDFVARFSAWIDQGCPP